MIKIQPPSGPLFKGATALLIALVSAAGLASQTVAAQFKLGAEANSFIENPPPIPNTYAAPQMVAPMNGGAAQYDNGGGQRFSGNASQQRPLQGGAQSLALPPAFLGSWSVQGKLTNMTAQPQYQQGIGGFFHPNTQDTWNIAGSPQQGYQVSNDLGASFPLTIYKATKNQAFIRYQHPISKTMAQEAIVMQLQNGATSFQGLERISIVKQGEQGTRAKITYELYGQRQR